MLGNLLSSLLGNSEETTPKKITIITISRKPTGSPIIDMIRDAKKIEEGDTKEEEKKEEERCD